MKTSYSPLTILGFFCITAACFFFPAKPVKAAVACSASAAAQNGISVTPSHGSVFYIDTGVTPKLDAGFIGYQVANNGTSTQSHLWVQVTSFTGGKLQLANSADTNMQLSSLPVSTTGTAYFLLKSTGATTLAQTHVVRVYNDRPDLTGASKLYECTFTFNKVQETIKAASNKVTNNGLNTAAAIEVSDTSPELGQAITISVEGETGNIGAGSSPDFDLIWLTPAAISTWPTRSLRLENVSVTFDANKNWSNTGDEVTYDNQLLIKNANGATVDGAAYRAYYTFRVIGKPQATVKAVPIAQIASGTQVKHTDTTGAGSTLDISFSSLTINASLTKTVTATSSLTVVTCGGSCIVPGGVNGETYVAVPYKLHATQTSPTSITVDDFIDTPASGAIFISGSAAITDIGRTSASTSDPVYLTSEAALNPRPYHFVGPFTFSSATSADLTYRMWVPVGSSANNAYAKIGDLVIGASASFMSVVTVDSTGTPTVSFVTSTMALPITITTDPATNVTTTTATLNGTVDPNGRNPLTATFKYGTAADLSGGVTVTATTPGSGILNSLTDPTTISVGITGLSSGTTYYYQAIAGTSTGEILSFTTQSVVAPPTATTQAATDITLTTATLNGSINPNLTSVTAIQFIYGTSPTLASGNTISTQDDGSGTAPMTTAGTSNQAFSQGVTGLTAGTTYYFKIRACTGVLSGVYPSVTCASFVDGSIMNFVGSAAPSATTTAATSVTTTSATLNGSVTANYATATVSFLYSTDPTLGTGTSTVFVGGLVTGGSASSVSAFISGLSASTTYYFQVMATNTQGTTTGSILNFTTSAASRTLTIDGASYTSSYTMSATPPTITATPSAGTGTIAFVSNTPSVCTINSSTGVVTFVTVGTCEIGASISANGLYSGATATSINFVITSAPASVSSNPVGGGGLSSSGASASNPSGFLSTPIVTVKPSAYCPVDCKALSWDLYIVNPDGSERHTNSSYAQKIRQNDGTTLLKFEDSGKDFDFDDIWITVDDRVCGDWKFQVTHRDANWKHRVMVQILHRGNVVDTREVWHDSSKAVGNTQSINASLMQDLCLAPKKAIDCRNLSIVPYIINPNGTIRRPGTKYVKETLLSSVLKRYGFEDKGDDFDFNDVVLDVDQFGCPTVTIAKSPSDARWHHQIYATIYQGTKPVKDILVWKDSQHTGTDPITIDLTTLDLPSTTETAAPSSCTHAGVRQGMTSGDKGIEVKSLQDFLKCVGSFPKNITSNGVFGETTKKAVTDFQQKSNLKPTGAIGPATFKKISSY